VWRASRVNDTPRIWQVLHQQASSASMIEMNMRQKNKVDVGDVEFLLSQPVEKERDAGVRPGIDESTPTALNNEVARVL
jgi:hypothetical protein